MQLFSPQIRPSTTISLTLLQDSETHRMGKTSESSPQRGEICVYFALVFSNLYTEKKTLLPQQIVLLS